MPTAFYPSQGLLQTRFLDIFSLALKDTGGPSSPLLCRLLLPIRLL